jgi:L-alanine-DL-glutamate epimerase-like enolase superfamily enzyme
MPSAASVKSVMRSSTCIESVRVSAYTVPTDAPESDGTLAWQSTTMVLVEITAGGQQGLGFTYADAATGKLIVEKLVKEVVGRDAMDIPGTWIEMVHAIRNLGRPGLASMAISAVDAALWDLKAKLLEVPLVTLLGSAREGIPVYGSGGFTSYSHRQLDEQLAGWAADGMRAVKIKIGREPAADLDRVRVAREAVGNEVELFVDANGAYERKQALRFAEAFSKYNVKWFEEPVSSDDLEGLRLIRHSAPPGIEIAAGEYGYDLVYFRRMLDAGAVDCLQADATRCAGISEFMSVAALCQAYSLPLSAHTAPSIHLHPCCAAGPVRHLEYFHDHVRIEHMLFEGALPPVQGLLYPDRSRPGFGLEFKRQDAERYAI